MTYVIELINIGRGKVCKTIETDLADLTLAENKALEEAGKNLMSQDIWIEQKGH